MPSDYHGKWAPWPTGAIVVATENNSGITKGYLYQVGYSRALNVDLDVDENNVNNRGYWVMNDFGVSSVYPESIFERAKLGG